MIDLTEVGEYIQGQKDMPIDTKQFMTGFANKIGIAIAAELTPHNLLVKMKFANLPIGNKTGYEKDSFVENGKFILEHEDGEIFESLIHIEKQKESDEYFNCWVFHLGNGSLHSFFTCQGRINYLQFKDITKLKFSDESQLLTE